MTEDGFYLKANYVDNTKQNLSKICTGSEEFELGLNYLKSLKKQVNQLYYPQIKFLRKKLLKNIEVKFIIVFNKEFFRREGLSEDLVPAYKNIYFDTIKQLRKYEF